MARGSKRTANEPLANGTAPNRKRAKISPSAAAPRTVQASTSQGAHVCFPDGVKDSATLTIVNESADANINGETLATPPSTPPMSADDEDDDEAPESISTSAAASQSRSRAAEAAQTARQQRAVEKAQRRARQERIEAQAQSRQRRQRQEPQETEQEDEQKWHQDIELLPEEVLAEEPPTRTAPSPPRDATQKRSRSQYYEKEKKSTRIAFRDETTPPDSRVGPVNVRVLAETNKMLAPKAEGIVKRMRENWLRGRTHGRMQRQKVNTGFLRS